MFARRVNTDLSKRLIHIENFLVINKNKIKIFSFNLTISLTTFVKKLQIPCSKPLNCCQLFSKLINRQSYQYQNQIDKKTNNNSLLH